MTKSANYEYLFIEEINKGNLLIDGRGKVWRTATRGGSNQYNKKTKAIDKREMKYKNNQGYISLDLRANNKHYHCLAHRLIWTYCNGKIPSNLQINHKNGIKTDNRPDNLEAVTHKENVNHAFEIGLSQHRGEKQWNSKLLNKDVMGIRKKYSEGKTQRQLSEEYNVCIPSVCMIVNRRTWKHI